MRCKKCGSELPEEALFCPVCGEKISPDGSDKHPEQNPGQCVEQAVPEETQELYGENAKNDLKESDTVKDAESFQAFDSFQHFDDSDRKPDKDSESSGKSSDTHRTIKIAAVCAAFLLAAGIGGGFYFRLFSFGASQGEVFSDSSESSSYSDISDASGAADSGKNSDVSGKTDAESRAESDSSSATASKPVPTPKTLSADSADDGESREDSKGTSGGVSGTKTLFVVKCSDYISLRSQPETAASVITTIPLGEQVNFLSYAENGFDRISYRGQTGYALAEYLSDTAESGGAAAVTLQVANCNDWISLRSAPSISASQICTVPLGEAVTFISTDANGFDKVTYRGITGYVLAKYLS